MTQRTTKQLKLRRGNTAEHSNFVGAVGEITVDTDLKTIRVHDGSTAGGFPLMRGDATINSIPWTSVTNRPTLFSGAYADLTGKPTLFSGDYADLTNKPTIPEVPTDVSAFTNDSEYVTSTQLSNSTAGLVQLLTNSLALKVNINQIPVVPTAVSAFNNDANYATETYVNNEINSLINGAPGALNTLNELSLALSNDENFSTTVVNSLANKVNSDDLALVATTGSYTDLTNKPTVLAIAPQWTANHTLLPGGENTRYLVGDAVYNNGNIYVANYENESMPVSDPIYWTNIGTGNRLNIDGRDIPNITYDQLTNKPTIPADVSDLTDTTNLLSGGGGGGINTGYFRFNNNILYTNAGQSIYIDPSNDEGDTGFIFVPGPGTADIDPVQIYNQLSGGVRIGSSDSLWTFGSSGTLTLPNNTTVGNNLEGTYSSSFLCLPWGVNDQTSGLFSSNSITRPLFNPLISTISVGWFVSGPGLTGVKEITQIVEMGDGDRAFIVDLTDGSLWADLSVNIPYRFYSPDYALTLNGTKLTVNSNEWKFNQAGHLTVPGDIHEKVGNDLEIAVHNNRNNDGTPGSAVLSLTNNDAVDSQTYTTLEVGAYGIKLNTDYEGVFTGARRTWEFKRNGTLTFPDLTEQTTAWTGSVSLISSGPTAPGSAVVAGENDVDFNFSDGVSTAVSVTRNSEIVSSKPVGLTLASNFDVKIVTDFTDNNRTWTFEGSTGNVELPRGSIIGETSNTTIITPPTATPDQSLVIRPTASQWAIESSGFIVYGSPITVTLTLQNWTYFGTVNYEITGPGVTEQSLGRPLTGKLIYAGVVGGPDAQSVTWTIPADSVITEFTFTVTGVDGTQSTNYLTENDPALYYNFEWNAMPTGYSTTVTNNGISNTEFSHVHLVAGNPATVDLYLGDDDHYVKIEKNALAAGDVVIGTNANTKKWRFVTDGTLLLPRDAAGNTDPYLWIAGGPTPSISSVDASLAGPANFQIVSDYLNLSGYTGAKVAIKADNGEIATDANMVLTTNNANVGNTYSWTFGTDGGITFPTLTVNLHNGGNQQGQVLQFGDVSRQAIITGPTPILGQSAQRLIIQGQNGGPGEGGDVYLWAGDSDSNGGDIKIYAGDADAVPGNGGYINIDAGNGYAQGGHLSLSAGNSALYGGNVTISAGYASQGTAGQVQLSTAGGSVNLAPDGNFTISKNVVLSKPVSIVTQSVTGTVYDNQQNPFTFRILKSANPQLSAAFADPNFVLRWTGTDEGSQAAAQQAPSGMNLTSFVSDDGTYWNFNSWFGLNGSNLAGSIFTVEYGMQVNYTTISTTNTNLRLQSGNKHWTFDTLGNLELPDDGKINYSPATPSDWSGTPPTTIQEAIDRLAALVKSLNSGTGA